MAQATHEHTTSRFHNLSSAALADALGQADALLKGAEAECKSLKDEIKRRGLLDVAGDNFTIRASEQIASRLDVSASATRGAGSKCRRFPQLSPRQSGHASRCCGLVCTVASPRKHRSPNFRRNPMTAKTEVQNWHRRRATKLAEQLPENLDDAITVLDCLTEILERAANSEIEWREATTTRH